MSVVIGTKPYTHYIDGRQVYPAGEWELKHEFPEGCIFSRREFSGTLTFGNIAFNGIADDYDWLMESAYCHRLDYEIYCNDELYWEGYIPHTISYEVDEDNCTIKLTPLLSDEYDCFVIYGDTEYIWSALIGTESIIIYDYTTGIPYDVLGNIDGCMLGDVLERYINATLAIDADEVCGFTGDIVSSFFWNDDYPDGTANTENYITESNLWDDIAINKLYLLRNELGGTADAIDQFTTFNTIVGWLRDMFNVYWYIDSNGDFRLEHLHYFEHDFVDRDHTGLPDDIDLTAIDNEFTGKALSIYKNKWKSLEDKLPSQETFEMMDAESEDFVGLPINYDEDCTYNYPKKQIREISQPEIFTDVPMLVSDPDSVTSEGFYMVAVKYDNLFTTNTIITGWPTDTYTFFNAVGKQIVRASTGGGAASTETNSIGAVVAGESYQVNISGYVNTLGENPTLCIVDGGGAVKSNQIPILASGTYLLAITANANPAYVQLSNTIACDWAIDDIYIHKLEDEWYVPWRTGILSGNMQNNGDLSIANLMDNYWRHGRVLENGEMNGEDEVFESANPNRLQVPITIPKCCTEIHWNTYYTTGLGTGKIYKASEKEFTHEVELLYDGT